MAYCKCFDSDFRSFLIKSFTLIFVTSLVVFCAWLDRPSTPSDGGTLTMGEVENRLFAFELQMADLRAHNEQLVLEASRRTSQIAILEESVGQKDRRWAMVRRVRDFIKEKRKSYASAPGSPTIVETTKIASAIVDAAAEFDVSVAFVVSVAERESAFDPAAISRAGAKGVMQVMDFTADEISGALGVRHFNLFDIKTNVRFGVYYLRLMLDIFGSEELALAAYNCGPSCAKRVQAGEISSYPMETQKYIEFVMPRFQQYRAEGF